MDRPTIKPIFISMFTDYRSLDGYPLRRIWLRNSVDGTLLESEFFSNEIKGFTVGDTQRSNLIIIAFASVSVN